MTGLLVTGARVVGADSCIESGWLATSGGVIEAFGPGTPDAPMIDGPQLIDARGATLLPGFVHVHVRGPLGHEVMDADTDGLTAMSRFFAEHGVTSFLATTWIAPTEETLGALRAVREVISVELPGATVLGAHMEGPYLSPVKCGAQDPRSIRPSDLDEARRFLDTGVGRLITVAPELASTQELVDLCLGRGTGVSIGHTDATYEQVVEAAAWGARHVTHTFDAMPPLHHRRPGPVGAAMVLDALLTELIADNHHVHPVVLDSFLRAKGPQGVTLVADDLRPTGLGSSQFDIGGRRPTVREGVVRLEDGTIAGGLLTMDVALGTLAVATGRPRTDSWPTSSRNGATVAGVADRKGAIRPRMDADLGPGEPRVDVRMTIVGGRIVYTAPVPATVA